MCLPLPTEYAFPTKGASLEKTKRALLALIRHRNAYFWGPPGAGKDAVVHAFSAWARCPAINVSFQPDRDLAPWFYRRTIGPEGSRWEYGHVWKTLTKGVEGRDGRRRPALLLLSDVDRADSSQVEWFRLLTDSIEGRILGPDGKTETLFPGTWFVETANTCGSGDPRGRATSAQPIDSTMLDRFGRMVAMTYLHWDDESKVLARKYPDVARRSPGFLDHLGKATDLLRSAIGREALTADFTHRSLCHILEEAVDRIDFLGETNAVPLLCGSLMAWLDGLEPSVRLGAKRLLDAGLPGLLDLREKM